MRIALISDTHTNRAAQDPQQSTYKGHFERVIADVNAVGVDAVLLGGDQAENGKPEEWDDFFQQAGSLPGRLWCVPGNHDIGNKRIPGKSDAASVTSERVAAYEKRFGRSWWTTVLNGIRVVGLNSLLLGSGLPEEAPQWEFLAAELSRPQAEPTLILMHYPPFLKAVDEPGDPYWNVEPAPRARLIELFRRPESRVFGILSGHLHRPNEAKLPTPDRGLIRVVTTPPVSFGLPIGKQAEGWTLVTVTSPNAFASEFRPIAVK